MGDVNVCHSKWTSHGAWPKWSLPQVELAKCGKMDMRSSIACSGACSSIPPKGTVKGNRMHTMMNTMMDTMIDTTKDAVQRAPFDIEGCVSQKSDDVGMVYASRGERGEYLSNRQSVSANGGRGRLGGGEKIQASPRPTPWTVPWGMVRSSCHDGSDSPAAQFERI